MKLNKIHYTLIIIILLISLIYVVIIISDKHDLNNDLTKWYAEQITINDSTDEEKINSLMNYTYHNGLGLCTHKSYLFEMLLNSLNYETRHVVLRCGDNCSHATTQVYINNEWFFYDVHLNKKFTNEEYKEMGFNNAFTHINCVDGSCSNINKITLIYTLLTNKVVYGEKI